jgi:hypothetical protein
MDATTAAMGRFISYRLELNHIHEIALLLYLFQANIRVRRFPNRACDGYSLGDAAGELNHSGEAGR